MALQHHEFELRLRDAEQLRLFVQASMAKREMRDASPKKAELECHRLELEAKESIERAARAEAERDTALHEVAITRLESEGALNTRAQIEAERARVQNALALVEEAHRGAEREHGATREALAAAGAACKKAEEENGYLADEKLALVIELGALKENTPLSGRRPLLTGNQWRSNLIQAVISFLTMVMGVALLRITYAEENRRFRMVCPILQFRSLRNSLPILAAPQIPRLLLLLRVL